ncbi:G2-specific serine/threonine protein kinase [Xylographa bjoerkii]|nr:G2-specific serine/threonine protein kinase [Xylographa bjoerkii]
MERYAAVPEDEEFLGRGSFGIVGRVRRISDGKIVACKTIHYMEGRFAKAEVEREFAILVRLQHVNIIRYLDVAWFPNRAKLYMEYCDKQSLQDLIYRNKLQHVEISEDYVWSILFQLVAALSYCHSGLQTDEEGNFFFEGLAEHSIILHRDLKPANVLLSSGNGAHSDLVKLCDFGLGAMVEEDHAPSIYVGAAQYLAPSQEISRCREGPIEWDTRCDMFSFGCTLYTLCMYKPPFEWHMEERETFDPIPDRFSERLRKCIYECISFAPRDRPTAIEVLQSTAKHLKHKPKPLKVYNKLPIHLPVGPGLTTDAVAPAVLNILQNNTLGGAASSACSSIRNSHTEFPKHTPNIPSVPSDSISSISSMTITDAYHVSEAESIEDLISLDFEDFAVPRVSQNSAKSRKFARGLGTDSVVHQVHQVHRKALPIQPLVHNAVPQTVIRSDLALVSPQEGIVESVIDYSSPYASLLDQTPKQDPAEAGELELSHTRSEDQVEPAKSPSMNDSELDNSSSPWSEYSISYVKEDNNKTISNWTVDLKRAHYFYGDFGGTMFELDCDLNMLTLDTNRVECRPIRGPMSHEDLDLCKIDQNECVRVGDALIVMAIKYEDIEILKLNMDTLEWSNHETKTSPKLLVFRSINAIGPKLYVTGTTSDESALCLAIVDLSKLGDLTLEWRVLKLDPKETPKARSDYTVVSYDKKLYLFGGRSVGAQTPERYNDTWVFDSETETWSKMEIVGNYRPSRRSSHGATIVNGVMYIYGGWDECYQPLKNALAAYNVEENRWYRVGNIGLPLETMIIGYLHMFPHGNDIIVLDTVTRRAYKLHTHALQKFIVEDKPEDNVDEDQKQKELKEVTRTKKVKGVTRTKKIVEVTRTLRVENGKAEKRQGFFSNLFRH